LKARLRGAEERRTHRATTAVPASRSLTALCCSPGAAWSPACSVLRGRRASPSRYILGKFSTNCHIGTNCPRSEGTNDGAAGEYAPTLLPQAPAPSSRARGACGVWRGLAAAAGTGGSAPLCAVFQKPCRIFTRFPHLAVQTCSLELIGRVHWADIWGWRPTGEAAPAVRCRSEFRGACQRPMGPRAAKVRDSMERSARQSSKPAATLGAHAAPRGLP
jgi:hypothetical protein